MLPATVTNGPALALNRRECVPRAQPHTISPTKQEAQGPWTGAGPGACENKADVEVPGAWCLPATGIRELSEWAGQYLKRRAERWRGSSFAFCSLRLHFA